MLENRWIEETDTRAMIRTLAQVASLDDGLAAKRRLLLEQIASLVDADCWFWTLLGRHLPGDQPTFSVFLKGGFSDEQFAKYLQIQEHPDMATLNAPFFNEYQKLERHITRLRQQIDPEGCFPQTDVYQLWQEADLGPLIFSLRPTSNGEASGVLFLRRFERPLFDERDNRIAHIMLSEVPWLHDDAWPNHPRQMVRALSPRLNTVTNLLLQGTGRKQMAAEMGISIHTVNDYVKEVYARFGVHSQSELIRRFVEGDGGDMASAI